MTTEGDQLRVTQDLGRPSEGAKALVNALPSSVGEHLRHSGEEEVLSVGKDAAEAAAHGLISAQRLDQTAVQVGDRMDELTDRI